MGRVVREWIAEKADPSKIAPDWFGERILDWEEVYSYSGDGKLKEFREACPYREGDVVWIKEGDEPILARIYRVCCELDNWEERRYMFKVQRATGEGLFSKLWERTWPGMIQRGYEAAREQAANV